MRRLLVILFTIAHLLATYAGRCETVWHDTGVAAAASTYAAVDHHAAGPHPVVPWMADEHPHDSELPDHSHVFHPDASAKVQRVQSDSVAILAPYAYTEMSALWVLSGGGPEASAWAGDAGTPVRQPPLSGRTSHLLF